MKKLLVFFVITFLNIFLYVQAQPQPNGFQREDPKDYSNVTTKTAKDFETNQSGYIGAFKYIAYVWNGQMYNSVPCHSKRDNGDNTTTFIVNTYTLNQGKKQYASLELIVKNEDIKSILEIVATNEPTEK